MNRDGFRPDPDKIASVIQYPEPKNLKQLRRFLGMASWYKKFLPDIATIADPLTRLTMKNFKYVWEEEQQRASDQAVEEGKAFEDEAAWSQRMKNLSNLLDDANHRSQEEQERHAEIYNARRREPKFDISDKVWKRN